MKRTVTILVAASLALMPLGALAETFTVETLDSNVFEPDPVTIQVGDSIEFVNPGQLPHTATAEDGSWDTGNLAPGQRKTITFDAPGEIPYVCIYHESLGMVGTIIVEGEAPAASPTQQPAPGTGQGAEPAPETGQDAEPAPAEPQVQSATVVAGASETAGRARTGPIVFALVGLVVAALIAGGSFGRRMKAAGR